MRYGSVCSGIEAATVAWHPLGWEAQWFSEIEPFPSAVLAHRFPDVPNLGDMTQIHLNQTFNDSTIDVLVGGTPCQSFSVAGLRKGLADPRGNLMLTFIELAARKRPQWVVWENVPGVLSSNGGKDFASFLGLITGREVQVPKGNWRNSGMLTGESSAYGVAWRICDAQYFGVAQRRRRVFVVGYLGDWRPAAAVLFEQHSLSGDSKKSGKKRKATPSSTQGSPGESGSTIAMAHGQANAEVTTNDSCPTLSCVHEAPIVTQPHIIDRAAFNQGENAQYEPKIEQGQTMPSLVAKGPHALGIEIGPSGAFFTETNPTLDARAKDGPIRNQLAGAVLALAFKARGGSEVETGEQGGTPGKKAGKGYLGQDEKTFTIASVQDQMIAQPIPIHDQATRHSGKHGDKQDGKGNGLGIGEPGDPMNTLTNGDRHAIAQPLAVDCYNQTVNEKTSQTIGSSASDVNHYGAVLQPMSLDCYNQTETGDKVGIIREQHGTNTNAVLQPKMAIRRLTPTECERLQGFPDSWTKIPWRGKPAEDCPDGPRYKACGNSMAVPVMHWIGKRIDYITNLLKETE